VASGLPHRRLVITGAGVPARVNAEHDERRHPITMLLTGMAEWEMGLRSEGLGASDGPDDAFIQLRFRKVQRGLTFKGRVHEQAAARHK
jgi:hypothetical protein